MTIAFILTTILMSTFIDLVDNNLSTAAQTPNQNCFVKAKDCYSSELLCASSDGLSATSILSYPLNISLSFAEYATMCAYLCVINNGFGFNLMLSQRLCVVFKERPLNWKVDQMCEYFELKEYKRECNTFVSTTKNPTTQASTTVATTVSATTNPTTQASTTVSTTKNPTTQASTTVATTVSATTNLTTQAFTTVSTTVSTTKNPTTQASTTVATTGIVNPTTKSTTLTPITTTILTTTARPCTDLYVTCPTGFTALPCKKCYQKLSILKSQAQHQSDCALKAPNAHLYVIDDVIEAKILQDYMKSLGGGDYFSSGVLSGGRWYWQYNGVQQPIAYLNWAGGEPSSTDNCLEMTPSGQNQIYGYLCASTDQAICEWDY